MIGYAREDINGCLNNSRDILFKVVEADFLREEGKNEEAQKILDGINDHHKAEALFKAFGKALDMATMEEPRIKEAWTTKGSL
mgnify:FL=1